MRPAMGTLLGWTRLRIFSFLQSSPPSSRRGEVASFLSWKRIPQVVTKQGHALRQRSHEAILFSKLCPIFPHCLSTKCWQTFSVISKRVTGFCFEGQEAKLRSWCGYLCSLLKMSNPLLGHRPYENRQQVGFRSWAIVCWLLTSTYLFSNLRIHHSHIEDLIRSFLGLKGRVFDSVVLG